MKSEQKAQAVRDYDEEFQNVLRRIFYFEGSEEDQSVQSFVDWCNSAGFGPVTRRPVYDMIAGRAKPTIKFLLAVLRWSSDPELHGFFLVDKTIAKAAAESLRTAADSLIATADRLAGNGRKGT